MNNQNKDKSYIGKLLFTGVAGVVATHPYIATVLVIAGAGLWIYNKIFSNGVISFEKEYPTPDDEYKKTHNEIHTLLHIHPTTIESPYKISNLLINSVMSKKRTSKFACYLLLDPNIHCKVIIGILDSLDDEVKMYCALLEHFNTDIKEFKAFINNIPENKNYSDYVNVKLKGKITIQFSNKIKNIILADKSGVMNNIIQQLEKENADTLSKLYHYFLYLLSDQTIEENNTEQEIIANTYRELITRLLNELY